MENGADWLAEGVARALARATGILVFDRMPRNGPVIAQPIR